MGHYILLAWVWCSPIISCFPSALTVFLVLSLCSHCVLVVPSSPLPMFGFGPWLTNASGHAVSQLPSPRKAASNNSGLVVFTWCWAGHANRPTIKCKVGQTDHWGLCLLVVYVNSMREPFSKHSCWKDAYNSSRQALEPLRLLSLSKPY